MIYTKPPLVINVTKGGLRYAKLPKGMIFDNFMRNFAPNACCLSASLL